ncbi:MAG: 50S ribosomal protein L16 [Nitrososphaerales archaeon]
MKGRNYKVIRGMPYTRRDFIPGAPRPKIAKFSTGNPSQDYDLKLELRAKERAQIRHNALEAARVALNKKLAGIGEGNYYLLMKTYPHIVLRENKMIATAGADRLQEGMRRAFGKPIGLAARVEVDNIILELSIKKENLEVAKDALKMASSKLPIPTYVKEIPLKQDVIEVKEK